MYIDVSLSLSLYFGSDTSHEKHREILSKQTILIIIIERRVKEKKRESNLQNERKKNK